MSSEPPESGAPEHPGYELPLRLFLGFRVLIDELHAELARQGHPELRPLHGFIFQAIGPAGTTASELGRRLGVTKQAAAKHITQLERLGYLERGPDPHDVRSKAVRLTARGREALARSAAIFDQLRAGWAAVLGPRRLRELEADLRRLTSGQPFPLDAPGWFGGARR